MLLRHFHNEINWSEIIETTLSTSQVTCKKVKKMLAFYQSFAGNCHHDWNKP